MKFVRSVAAQRSFELLKEALVALVALPTLTNPDYSLQFKAYCNASAGVVGALLTQKCRPIAFTLKILKGF